MFCNSSNFFFFLFLLINEAIQIIITTRMMNGIYHSPFAFFCHRHIIKRGICQLYGGIE